MLWKHHHVYYAKFGIFWPVFFGKTHFRDLDFRLCYHFYFIFSWKQHKMMAIWIHFSQKIKKKWQKKALWQIDFENRKSETGNRKSETGFSEGDSDWTRFFCQREGNKVVFKQEIVHENKPMPRFGAHGTWI